MAAKILIADDIKANINILIKILGNDYDLAYVQSGEEVLSYVRENTVDLILLDILMPGISGYEVCKTLKEDTQTKGIPIIFITSKSSTEDEAKGLELGAVDYITKPFNYPIIKARIKTHLALKKALKELEEQNVALIEMANLKEDVELITRHDLKNPLGAIISFCELCSQTKNLPPEIYSYLDIMSESGYKMMMMINLSLDLFKMERGTYQLNPVPVDLTSVIDKILIELDGMISAKKLTIEFLPQRALDHFIILGEELLCYSMLFNLINNAIEASPRQKTITIDMTDRKTGQLTLHNWGVVPEEIRNRFFEKYITSRKAHGTGLGTYSAKLIAVTQGGDIAMETSEEKGTTLTIQLPLLPI